MSSGTKKKNDKPKNVTKRKKPQGDFEKAIENEINELSEFHPEKVSRDNQILKAIFKSDTESEELQPVPTEQNLTKKYNLKIKTREVRGTRKLKIKPTSEVGSEQLEEVNVVDVLKALEIYGVELRFEKVANKEKMILLTNNGDENSPYKQKILEYVIPKKISLGKLDEIIKKTLNKTALGRFNGDKILTIIEPRVNIEVTEPVEEDFVQHPAPAPEQNPAIEPLEDKKEEEPEELTDKVNDKQDEQASLAADVQQMINNYKTLTPEEIELQKKIGMAPSDVESKEYNTFLLNKEKLENGAADKPDFEFLYPELNDPNFNIKIAKRKEFNDTKYLLDTELSIEEQADKMCNADFELLPHQLFVKNFLSFQTPYNALLLYHMLGTGKTCTAIGVAEEMRSYMKQVGLVQKNHKILIIASPNVQNNFRLQLFDERKLKKENGIWNLNTCVGNSLLAEINPSSMSTMTRNQIITQITVLIKTYYEFIGYDKLANIIRAETKVNDETIAPSKEIQKLEIQKIRKYFNNRLIIIDEVHNISLAQDNKQAKKVGSLLMRIVRYSENIRLLLLSATPVYNSYKEIIWLTNLLNAVDKRSSIKIEDIFDKDGKFIETAAGSTKESGRELLKRKLTGYVSYIRGENPYTFPYRIYPDTFAPENTFLPWKPENLFAKEEDKYPKLQMNLKPIETPLQQLRSSVFLTSIGPYQESAYKFIMDNLRQKSFNTFDAQGEEREMPNFENMESFGYTHLQEPLESLGIVFPNPDFNEDIQNETSESEKSASVSSNGSSESVEKSVSDNSAIIKNMLGKTGLSNTMTYTTIRDTYELRNNFEYKPEILAKYGRFLSPDNIGKYSGKISKICDVIKKSTGIVIVYSQYIDGGVVPLAIALEEMGFARYGSASYTTSLLKTPQTPIDSLTMKKRDEFDKDKLGEFSQAKYVMITGDKTFSPNNLADIKYVTNDDNKYGEKVKVILISQAAAEGLDFKNIRQVHILSPWYNLNRVEQIIGRGVRNLSHCGLPFKQRNVEIYLHATLPKYDEEPADLYLYRYAEKKAVQVGEVTRLMKEVAVDCILNIAQTKLTVDDLLANAQNKDIKLELSDKREVEFKIGDKPFSGICDYMDNCNFVCSPNQEISEADLVKSTYSLNYAKTNYAAIVKRIRQLFRESFFYKREHLFNAIRINREYPDEHIYYALSRFVDNKSEAIIDKYGRTGYLVNNGEYYLFQPIEITDEHSSIFERSIPIEYSNLLLKMELPMEKEKPGEPENIVIQEKGDVVEFHDKYNKILNQIREHIEIMEIERVNREPMDSGEIDWYKHLGRVHKILVDVHKIPVEAIMKYLVYHFLDTLPFDDRMVLINDIYKSPDTKQLNDIETNIKSYFDEKMFIYNRLFGIVISNNNKLELYIKSPDNGEWSISKPTEYRSFLPLIQRKLQSTKDVMSQYVGFMSVFKKDEIVFKTKDMMETRNNKGSKCIGNTKNDIIKRLNKVLEKGPFYVEGDEKNPYNKDILTNTLKMGFCVILEMIIRHFDDYEKQTRPPETRRAWFFDLEKSLITRVAAL
jgi:hypothetical protein